jgi:hypothetical protein
VVRKLMRYFDSIPKNKKLTEEARQASGRNKRDEELNGEEE